MTYSSTASPEFVPGTSREARTTRTLRADLIAQVVRTTPTLEEAVLAALDESRKKEIAGRIKELREHSPYTQPALAEHLGYKTVRGYQKAEAEGGMEFWRYEKLAELYGVSVDYILRGDRPDEDGNLPQLDRIEADLAALRETVDGLVTLLAGEEIAQAVESAAAEPSSKPGGRARKSRAG